jgi:hypothetical protein
VSPTGSDSNDCSLATPCRNLQAAVYKSVSGGEITVLGTAGYSGGATLVIDRAISIVNPGAFEAGISPPASGLTGIGIVINAGPNDAVSLRGLTIDGTGAAATGIKFNTGKSLTVQDCIIRHVTHEGIGFYPSATSALTVSNSVVADNGGDGIVVQTFTSASGVVTAVFNRVQTNNNSFNGISVDGSGGTGPVNATFSDSVANGNGGIGLYVNANGAANISLTAFHSVVANNVNGVNANHPGATIFLAQSLVTGNGYGWVAQFSGQVASYGDNYIDPSQGSSGSLTPIGRQ